MRNTKPLKVILTLIVAGLCAVNITAQDKITPKEQSKLEQFSGRSGTLLEKTFEDLGTVGRVKLQVMTLRDMLSSARVTGVRFEYDTFERYSSSKLAFLDADEVDALLISIDIISNKVLVTSPASYTEVAYSSRSGFSTGCYFADSKWTAFIKLEKYDPKSIVAMSSDNLSQLAGLLKTAKAKF